MTSPPSFDSHSMRPPAPDHAQADTAAADEALSKALDAAMMDLSPAEAEALRWLVRRQDGLDDATEAEFQAWLAADPANREAFEDMAGIWQGFDDIPDDDVVQLKAGLVTTGTNPTPASATSMPGFEPRAAQEQAAPPASIPLRVRVPRRGWFHGLAQWAPHALTTCLVVLTVGGGWLAWDHWWQQPVFQQHYAAARGQQVESRLPDGSTIRLDAATVADVTLYRQRREVSLPEGQIMFTVQGDAERPFHVMAGAARITVVGTRFSVRYTPSLGNRQVLVAVEHGRVRVTRTDAGTPGPDNSVELTAGQTVAADGDGRLGPIGQVSLAGVAPWREYRVDFEDVPLAAALGELARYGDVGLTVHDPAVAALHVSGSVDLRRLDDFARSLPQVLPVRLKQRDGTTEVLARKP